MNDKIRIDCCRKCGMESSVKQRCSICTKPIKFACERCHLETDEQIHSMCRLVDINHKSAVYEAA
ncbi:MAG: hypothetical protein OEL84_08570 [Nitrosopumilus sp.]|nr:hypothetical protein [Nitrosopumilus sp.]MDH3341324.1 hypothetical protein [Nitrosopumilus sp.]